jgi:fatty acid desaturase
MAARIPEPSLSSSEATQVRAMTTLTRLHRPHGRRDSAPGWMMIMCVPMVVILVALVATGVASAGLLLAAVMCVAMMAVMMRAMSGGGGGEQ